MKSVDLENAREPPIAVLPFSIAKSTTEPAPASAQYSFFGAGSPKLPTLVSTALFIVDGVPHDQFATTRLFLVQSRICYCPFDMVWKPR